MMDILYHKEKRAVKGISLSSSCVYMIMVRVEFHSVTAMMKAILTKTWPIAFNFLSSFVSWWWVYYITEKEGSQPSVVLLILRVRDTLILYISSPDNNHRDDNSDGNHNVLSSFVSVDGYIRKKLIQDKYQNFHSRYTTYLLMDSLYYLSNMNPYSKNHLQE